MSGIPVYTSSPISAAKADGVTPQTTAAPIPQSDQDRPTPKTSTTTAVPPGTASYSARPGAPVMAAPTSAAQRYAPLQPTPTTKSERDTPPAPQPGAVPIPPSTTGQGQQSQPTPTYASRPQYYPPQMNVPPPTTAVGAQAPYSLTSSAVPSDQPAAYPVSLPTGAAQASSRSFDHPPGYVQDPYASDMTSGQVRAQENYHTSNHSYGDSQEADPIENAWNAAKSWASSAGKKLSEVEAEVWKRVNK